MVWKVIRFMAKQTQKHQLRAGAFHLPLGLTQSGSAFAPTHSLPSSWLALGAQFARVVSGSPTGSSAAGVQEGLERARALEKSQAMRQYVSRRPEQSWPAEQYSPTHACWAGKPETFTAFFFSFSFSFCYC